MQLRKLVLNDEMIFTIYCKLRQKTKTKISNKTNSLLLFFLLFSRLFGVNHPCPKHPLSQIIYILYAHTSCSYIILNYIQLSLSLIFLYYFFFNVHFHNLYYSFEGVQFWKMRCIHNLYYRVCVSSHNKKSNQKKRFLCLHPFNFLRG